MTSTDEQERARAGQPIEIAALFITVSFGVILWLMFKDGQQLLFDYSKEHGTTETAATGTQYLMDAWDATLFVFVGIAVFGLIALSVYRRQTA